MANSLLADLLKTPSQVREEQMQKLRAEGLQRAGLLQAPTGARTALPSIYTNIARSGIASAGENVANIARLGSQGLGGLLSAAGAPQAGQALAQATVTPEERQAAQAQSVLKGLDMTNPEQLAEASKKLQSLGLSGAATSLLQRAQKLQSGQLDMALTASKIQTEAAKQADLLAKAGKSQAEIATEVALRNPQIDEINAKTLAQQALARQRTAEAVQTETLTPIKAALENKRIEAESAGIDLTTRKMSLISSQISTEEIQQRANEQKITESEAKTQLLEAQVDRYLALTPGEVIEQAQNIEKLKAGTEKEKQQARLAEARLGDVGMTDFLREANEAGLTEEEYKALTKQRVEARARSGDVSGFGEQVINTKLGLVTNKIAEAQGAGKAMSTAQTVLTLVPNMSTGLLQTPKAIFAKIGSELGIDSAKQTAFANELFGVLKEGLVLEQAGNLKGALSDKDLKFLQNAIGGRELRPEVITEIFANLYYQRYADQKVAEYLDGRLGEFTDEDIRKYNVTEDTKNLQREFYLEAKSQLAIPTFDSAD